VRKKRLPNPKGRIWLVKDVNIEALKREVNQTFLGF